MGTRTAILVANLAGTANPAAVIGPATAGDSVNDHEWAFRSGDRLFAKNTGAGAQALTLVSVADSQGRTGDAVANPAAGEYALVGPLKEDGWEQGDGSIYIDLAEATWELLVLRG